MTPYIYAKNSEENAWEQISVHMLVEFLYANKNYKKQEILDFIRELTKQEKLFWNEQELINILDRLEKSEPKFDGAGVS